MRSGGVVVGPTDTVYGIFANATDSKAIKKIFEMKGRSQKPLLIFVRDIAMARWYAYISDIKAKFLEKVWPGAVTVIFHHKEKLPKILTGKSNTIGIRMPDHAFLSELLERLDFPLAQTSANASGKPVARNIREIKEYFKQQKIKPDLIIDGGELPDNPSTIIDLTRDKAAILRTGVVSKEELEKMLNL